MSPSTFDLAAQRLAGQLKVRHLRVVVALGQLRNASHVARQFHISAAAISKTLAEVEALTGMALFDRGHHEMRPTAAGLCMIEESRLVLLQLERMAESMASVDQGVVGSLHLACSTVSAQGVIADALAGFQRAYPRVRSSFTMANDIEYALAQLELGEFDLFFSYADRRFDAPGLASQRVIPEQKLYVVASGNHPLARARRPIGLAQLHEATWALPSSWSRLRQHLESLFQGGGLGLPERGVVTSDLSMIAHLMRTAGCVTLMPERVATRLRRDGMGVILRFDVPGLSERVDAIWCDRYQPRKTATLFRDIVTRQAQA